MEEKLQPDQPLGSYADNFFLPKAVLEIIHTHSQEGQQISKGEGVAEAEIFKGKCVGLSIRVEL